MAPDGLWFLLVQGIRDCKESAKLTSAYQATFFLPAASKEVTVPPGLLGSEHKEAAIQI